MRWVAFLLLLAVGGCDKICSMCKEEKAPITLAEKGTLKAFAACVGRLKEFGLSKDGARGYCGRYHELVLVSEFVFPKSLKCRCDIPNDSNCAYLLKVENKNRGILTSFDMKVRLKGQSKLRVFTARNVWVEPYQTEILTLKTSDDELISRCSVINEGNLEEILLHDARGIKMDW